MANKERNSIEYTYGNSIKGKVILISLLLIVIISIVIYFISVPYSPLRNKISELDFIFEGNKDAIAYSLEHEHDEKCDTSYFNNTRIYLKCIVDSLNTKMSSIEDFGKKKEMYNFIEYIDDQILKPNDSLYQRCLRENFSYNIQNDLKTEWLSSIKRLKSRAYEYSINLPECQY